MAQRGAAGRKSEILKHTGMSLFMQPAVGPAKLMTGILMGAETQDSHRKPFVLVVPDVSVYDPAMSESLIPVGRLIEAGFSINHRILLSHVWIDFLTYAFSRMSFLTYGSTFSRMD